MKWKTSRRRGFRVGRVVLLSLLLAAAVVALSHHLRPLPLPWLDVGSEQVVTPEFDIADPENRLVLQQFVRDTSFRGQWLGAACQPDAAMPAETYVVTRIHVGAHLFATTRIVVTLGTDGEVVLERSEPQDGAPVVRRRLDEADAIAFRALLLDGGYAQMPPAAETDRNSGVAAQMQSCIRGRYYGVARRGKDLPGQPSLHALAARIEKFVDPAAPLIPYR